MATAISLGGWVLLNPERSSVFLTIQRAAAPAAPDVLPFLPRRPELDYNVGCPVSFVFSANTI